MKTKLIFVRHGQSAGNLRRAFLGHTDLDLSELGYRQAEAVKCALHDTHIDVIYSSDLRRAYNTGLPTAKDHALDITASRELREVNAGEWEDRLFTDLIEKYPITYADIWLNNVGVARPDGGESVEELRLRVCAEVERIVKENSGKTIAVFTHATPIRALCGTWQGLVGERLRELPWVSNASITYVEHEDGVYSILDYGNEDHLGGLITRLPKTV